MNNQGKSEEDILKQYLNPEKIEKPHVSFTYRLMTRISLEKIPGTIRIRAHKRNLIPAVSAFVTTILIIIPLFFPDKGNNKLLLPGSDFIRDLEIPLVNLSSGSLPSFDIPVLITYLLIAILLLGLFDMAISALFYRRDKYQK
jgi:hypothetical protein